MEALYLFEDPDENPLMAIIVSKEFYQRCIGDPKLTLIDSIELKTESLVRWPTDTLLSQDMSS